MEFEKTCQGDGASESGRNEGGEREDSRDRESEAENKKSERVHTHIRSLTGIDISKLQRSTSIVTYFRLLRLPR